MLAFGENDLRLFTGTDATVRALIADAALPARTKAPADYFLVQESIIKSDSDFTLNLDPKIDNFTALPAGYEIARQPDKTWVVPAHAPYILFPNAGGNRATRRFVAEVSRAMPFFACLKEST